MGKSTSAKHRSASQSKHRSKIQSIGGQRCKGNLLFICIKVYIIVFTLRISGHNQFSNYSKLNCSCKGL
jgi:hypothetical protein